MPLSLTKEEYLTLHESLLEDKGPKSVLEDLKRVARPRLAEFIDEAIKAGVGPDLLLEYFKIQPVKTKGIGEAIEYGAQRAWQIARERTKGAIGEAYEARYARMPEAIKHGLFSALELLGIPTAPLAVIGESVEHALRRKGAPPLVASLAGGLVEAVPATGGVVKTAAKRMLKPVSTIAAHETKELTEAVAREAEKLAPKIEPKKLAEVEQKGYARHLQITDKPIPPDTREEIRDVLLTLFRLEKKQRALYRETLGPKAAKLESYLTELATTYEPSQIEKAKGALRGSLKEVLAEHPEFVREVPHFSDEHLVKIIDAVSSSKLNVWEKWEVYSALTDLMVHGRVPARHHLKALSDFLGLPELPIPKTVGQTVRDIAGASRAILASMDMSAVLRQGVLCVRRPQFWKNIPAYLRAFNSTKYEEIMDSIVRDPMFSLAKKSNLPLTTVLTGPEEAFITDLYKKIPFFGQLIEASERGYTGFINKLRFDIFKDMAQFLYKRGYTFEEHRELFEGLANYVGVITGRGPLGRGALEAAIARMGLDFFFAPRLISARLYMLNPQNYIKAPKELRAEMIKDVLALSGMVSAVGLMAYGLGADVDLDPRSSDFMKARIGNLRLDFSGGFQPYVVLMSRLISGELVSSSTGKLYDLGPHIGEISPLELIHRTFEGKLAPVPAFFARWIQGAGFAGARWDFLKEISNLAIPLFWKDLVEAIDDDPRHLPLAVLSGVGVGVNAYSPNSAYDDLSIPREIKHKVDDAIRKYIHHSIPVIRSVGGIPLTTEEQERVRQAFGPIAYKTLYGIVSSPGWEDQPSYIKLKSFEKAIKMARQAVEAQLFPHRVITKDLKIKDLFLMADPSITEKEAEQRAERIVREIERLSR